MILPNSRSQFCPSRLERSDAARSQQGYGVRGVGGRGRLCPIPSRHDKLNVAMKWTCGGLRPPSTNPRHRRSAAALWVARLPAEMVVGGCGGGGGGCEGRGGGHNISEQCSHFAGFYFFYISVCLSVCLATCSQFFFLFLSLTQPLPLASLALL